MTSYRLRHQRGFGYIAAIMLLVVLAGLAAGLIRLSTTQQVSSSLDLLSARAYQAAGAGIQWSLYNALTTGACPSQTLDLSAASGFRVTVTCTSIPFNEGESSPGTPRSKTLYSISAVACNSNACPDNARATTQDYVERRRVATACITGTLPAVFAC